MFATSCNVWTLMNFAYLWMQFKASEIICANSKGISLHHCLRGGAKRLLPLVPLMCLDTGNRRQKKEKWKLLGIAWICKFAEVSVLMFIRLDAAFRLAGYLCCLQFTQMIFSTHYGLTSVTSLLWLLYLLCMFLGNAASQCCGNVLVMLMSSIGKTVTRTAKKEEYAYKILQTRFCMVLWGERLARSQEAALKPFLPPWPSPAMERDKPRGKKMKAAQETRETGEDDQGGDSMSKRSRPVPAMRSVQTKLETTQKPKVQGQPSQEP